MAAAAVALPPAHAGAWTREKGDGLAIFALSLHELLPADDLAGLDRLKGETSLYLEYGLTDRITLVGRAAWQTMTVTEKLRGIEEYQALVEPEPDPLRDDPDEDWDDDGIPNRDDPAPPLPPVYETRTRGLDLTPPAASGLGGIEAGARLRVFQSGRWVGSVQAGVTVPGGGENRNNDRFGEGGGAFDLRALAGRSFGRSSFVSVSTGWRAHGSDRPDEARLDITAGTHVARGVRIMAQTYSVWSIGQAARSNYSYAGHRAQVSVLWPIDDERRAQVSVLSTFARDNMSQETAVIAAVWRRF